MPSKRIAPAVGASCLNIQRATVLLPQPASADVAQGLTLANGKTAPLDRLQSTAPPPPAYSNIEACQ